MCHFAGAQRSRLWVSSHVSLLAWPGDCLRISSPVLRPGVTTRASVVAANGATDASQYLGLAAAREPAGQRARGAADVRARTPHRPPHRGGGRRLALVHERSALGRPAGRAHRRGGGRRDRLALPGRRRRLRMGADGSEEASTSRKTRRRSSPTRSAAPSTRAAASPCAPASSRAIPRRCCSMPPTAPTSWSWAAAGTADSPRRCSARSASTACITRTAPLS